MSCQKTVLCEDLKRLTNVGTRFHCPRILEFIFQV